MVATANNKDPAILAVRDRAGWVKFLFMPGIVRPRPFHMRSAARCDIRPYRQLAEAALDAIMRNQSKRAPLRPHPRMPSASPPNSPVFDAPADSAGPAPGSDRVFGNFFGALFAGIGAYALWRGHALGWLGLGLGGVLAALAALAPHSLRRLNHLWLKLGLLLARIVNPLVIGAMFFLVITPMGLLMRAFGKRPLSLRFDPDAVTYWIERSPRGPQPDSMRDQF